MNRDRITVLAFSAVLLLPGCTRLGGLIGYADEEDLAPPQVPPHLLAREKRASGLARVTMEGEGAPGEAGGSALPSGLLPGGIPSADDIVWTNPDDPDAPLPGLEETLAAVKTQGDWLVSYRDARKVAMRSGKPILMWFTKSQGSPLCPILSAELFSRPQFESWASEHVVRLRVDLFVKGRSDEDLRKREQLEKLRTRYKARSLPTVLVMAPDGTVTGRYRGYKRDEPEFYWGRIRNATRSAEIHHKEWKTKMEKEGYRDWEDRKGRSLFAKLYRYQQGDMILVEPDGRMSRTSETKLSDADRMWIAAEKAKRER